MRETAQQKEISMLQQAVSTYMRLAGRPKTDIANLLADIKLAARIAANERR